MTEYVTRKQVKQLPRIPLEGSLDLTYRCNNNCRHCWLWLPANAPEREQELTFEEIKDIVNQARRLGTRSWGISGGEPMLRPDFEEIFDFITHDGAPYSLNTNGTLITPRIARLMQRKGVKMVSLYGATPEVHDHITRHPGSFELTMQGIAYLKEAGARFIPQLMPMRDNYHQWSRMVELARSLSPVWRIGGAWLYLSANGDPRRNQDIRGQRLEPRQVIEVEPPDITYEETIGAALANEYQHIAGDDRLFAACIATRQQFHVDPFGKMSFCPFVKDAALRYDLRQGTLRQGWEEFLPSVAGLVHGGAEYLENCACCELRDDCRWCPVYGYLEHRRFSAPVKYLCAVAREKRLWKGDWLKAHRRFYQIAGITIQVDADLPITDATFHPVFKQFEVDGPGEDTVKVRHHFALPEQNGQGFGREVYRRLPWIIYERGDSWVYVGHFSPGHLEPSFVAVFSRDHRVGRVYSQAEASFRIGYLRALTLFQSDQVLIARLLADRQGFYLHSSAAILNGQGLVFVGKSGAGKSTTLRLLAPYAQVLCQDRNIVRRWPDGWRVHGTWSDYHDVPIASAGEAPLRAVLFLEQANQNRLVPLTDRREIVRRLLANLIRPFETADWWEKTLTWIEQLARETPCYVMQSDASNGVVDLLQRELAR